MLPYISPLVCHFHWLRSFCKSIRTLSLRYHVPIFLVVVCLVRHKSVCHAADVTAAIVCGDSVDRKWKIPSISQYFGWHLDICSMHAKIDHLWIRKYNCSVASLTWTIFLRSPKCNLFAFVWISFHQGDEHRDHPSISAFHANCSILFVTSLFCSTYWLELFKGINFLVQKKSSGKKMSGQAKKIIWVLCSSRVKWSLTYDSSIPLICDCRKNNTNKHLRSFIYFEPVPLHTFPVVKNFPRVQHKLAIITMVEAHVILSGYTIHLKRRLLDTRHGYNDVKCKSIFRFGPIHIPIFYSWLLQLPLPVYLGSPSSDHLLLLSSPFTYSFS